MVHDERIAVVGNVMQDIIKIEIVVLNVRHDTVVLHEHSQRVNVEYIVRKILM